MSDSLLNHTRNSLCFVHAKLLEVTQDLPAAQFYWRPGPQAPPIGWHLWHIARWADRIQTFFPVRDGKERRQIWEREALAARWDLDPTTLGPVQTGEGMEHDAAVHLTHQISQEHIVDYARRCFAAFDRELDAITVEETEWVRTNSMAYGVGEDGRLVTVPGRETVFANELVFHAGHAARHLGMVEALRGAQGSLGTATI